MLVRNCMLFIMLITAFAPKPSLGAGDGDPEKTAGRTHSGGGISYFPTGDLYPAYAADPFRATFGLEVARLQREEIPDSTGSRINLRAGGVLGVVRSQSPDDADVGWQMSVMGGFTDVHDGGHSLDNIGWDGHYGILVTSAAAKGLGFKLGLLHDSSHIGDEYIARTGRQRIGYTRQEVTAGTSWSAGRQWRLYAEAGYAFSLGNETLQEPWRAQLGLEFESHPLFGKETFRWYVAIDAQSMQERDWRIDVAAQTGLVARSSGRTWRFGATWYNGRPLIGEFFLYTERSLSLGVWIDI